MKSSETSMRRLASTALGGTSIEWYDFFIYGTAAALVFPTLFFPDDMPRYVALIASFSTFAVGFLARPIGGVVFGHFGDRVGRKIALVVALSIMGVATTVIGLLPTYAEIGVVAPLGLIFCRFAQGLAIGGQWGGAMLLVTENAPSNKRGFYGAFAQAGAPMGVILANLAFLMVSATVSDEAFMSWGWRVPFLVSIVLVALALYVQFRLEDTPAFKALQEAKTQEPEVAQKSSPVVQALKRFPKQIFLGAGAFLAVQVSFYIFIVFVVSYGTDPEGLAMSRSDMLLAVLVSSSAQIPALFYFAAYSDRNGRIGVYKLGAVLMGLWAFAVFPIMNTGSLVLITAALCLAQVFLAMMYGPQAAMLTELFSAEVRYSGASLGYQLGAILGGALAPMAATALLATFGNAVWISVYIAFACALTWISVHALRDAQSHQVNPEA
ncbi:MAG: MFS transporter [Pseudomonadales bacterium]